MIRLKTFFELKFLSSSFSSFLSLKSDKRFPVEQFGATGSHSTVASPLLFSEETIMSSKVLFCQIPVGLSTCSTFGIASQATQSWQPPAPRESTETGWGAALTQLDLIHRWNRNPRPRPQKFSKLLLLMTFCESCIF